MKHLADDPNLRVAVHVWRVAGPVETREFIPSRQAGNVDSFAKLVVFLGKQT